MNLPRIDLRPSANGRAHEPADKERCLYCGGSGESWRSLLRLRWLYPLALLATTAAGFAYSIHSIREEGDHTRRILIAQHQEEAAWRTREAPEAQSRSPQPPQDRR